MDENIYAMINKFECCGNIMVTVIINKSSLCYARKRL